MNFRNVHDGGVRIAPPNLNNAEECADAFLADLGISHHREIDPKLFAECLDIKVALRPLPGFDGCLLRFGSIGTILCNEQTRHQTRIRFTIAHELGHWFLHPNQSQDFLFTEENVARHKASPMEAEANAFAGALLMPRKWFGKLVSGAQPLVSTIIGAANEFDVSVMAATRRFLDLTAFPSMAIFSDGEQVKWSWSSRGADHVFLKPGTDISPECTAFECSDSPEVATRVGAIPNSGEDWFPDDFNRERIMVTEQSCRLYEETVMTLLQIDMPD